MVRGTIKAMGSRGWRCQLPLELALPAQPWGTVPLVPLPWALPVPGTTSSNTKPAGGQHSWVL